VRHHCTAVAFVRDARHASSCLMVSIDSEYAALTGGDGSIEVEDVLRIGEWKEVSHAPHTHTLSLSLFEDRPRLTPVRALRLPGVQAQVRVWIETIPNCKTYGQCFEEHKIDGSVMFLLDDSTLRQ